MIKLIGLEKEHLSYLLKWRNDPEVQRWIFQKWPLSLAEQEKWFNSYLGNERYKILTIYHESDKKNIGYIRLASIDYQNSSVEIGGDIGEREYRGKGIGKIMYREALKLAFDELNMNRVYLHVLEDNEVAINLYTKIGFKKDGLLRQFVFKDGKFRNVFVMSMLREEYLKIKETFAE